MCDTKWKDKSDVSLLSANYFYNIEGTELKGREEIIPIAVHDYSIPMGGIGRADQHLASYPVIKTQGKKYHYKNTTIKYLRTSGPNVRELVIQNKGIQKVIYNLDEVHVLNNLKMQDKEISPRTSIVSVLTIVFCDWSFY